jgi:hypothetical protein
MPRGEPQKNVEQQKRVRHGWESLCHVFVSLWKLKGRFLDSLFSSSSSPFRLWFIYVFIYLAVHISFLILTDLHSNCHLYSYTPPPPALVHTHYMVLPNSLFSFSWPFITYLGEEEKKNKVAGTIYTNFLFFKKSSSLWLIDSAFPARFVIEPTQQQGRGRGQRESQQTMETRKKESYTHYCCCCCCCCILGYSSNWPDGWMAKAQTLSSASGTFTDRHGPGWDARLAGWRDGWLMSMRLKEGGLQV